jgi:hypothetical protein
MNTIDQFGKDPTVQRTRKLFSKMGKLDKDLFETLKLDAFDSRVRSIRDSRQRLYEKAFTAAMYKGFFMDENTAILLFNHCQKIAVTKYGFEYPFELSESPELSALVKEASE